MAIQDAELTGITMAKVKAKTECVYANDRHWNAIIDDQRSASASREAWLKLKENRRRSVVQR